MIWLIMRLRRDFATWDRPIQISVLTGAILLLVALVVGIFAPPQARAPILIGAGLLLLVVQVAVLWGNRGMINTYSQAQRHYLAGEFDVAVRVLEAARATGKINARLLTLLGNTYRQLGRLDESAAVLYEAVDKTPDHYFPLIGFGRTLLAQGDYTAAAQTFIRARAVGAPPLTLVDLGEALHRQGDSEGARAALIESLGAPFENMPERALMQAYLLYRLGETEAPEPALIAAGLPFWAAASERFAHTPYGAALYDDIQSMHGLAGEQ